MNDVATFCDRNPETCARGKDAFGVFVQKAQFGARMLIDLINGRTESGAEGRSAAGLQDLFEPARFDLSASHDSSIPRSRRGLVWAGSAGT